MTRIVDQRTPRGACHGAGVVGQHLALYPCLVFVQHALYSQLGEERWGSVVAISLCSWVLLRRFAPFSGLSVPHTVLDTSLVTSRPKSQNAIIATLNGKWRTDLSTFSLVFLPLG